MRAQISADVPAAVAQETVRNLQLWCKSNFLEGCKLEDQILVLEKAVLFWRQLSKHIYLMWRAIYQIILVQDLQKATRRTIHVI
jgi:hypothetical protein